MKAKKLVYLLVLVLLGLVVVSCGKKDDRIQIGILQFADAGALDDARMGFIDKLNEEGFVDGENIKITVENCKADFDLMMTQVKKLIRKSDLVLGIATPAAMALANEAKDQNKNIPILFTAVTDPIDAGLIDSNLKPGGNITGTNDMNPIEEQIDLVKALLPNATKVGVLYTSSEPNSKIQFDLAEAYATSIGLTVVEQTITSVNDLQQAARSLARSVDIIYIPTDNTIAAAIDTLDNILKEEKTPVIVGEANMVSILPALTVGIDYYRLGSLTALQAIKILNKEAKAGDIPSTGLDNFTLAINVENLENIGIEIPESLLERIGK